MWEDRGHMGSWSPVLLGHDHESFNQAMQIVNLYLTLK